MKKTILLALIVLLGVGFINAQTRVTGKVTSADDGSPLPYVTIVVKGATITATTDISGNYSISMPEGSSVLVFSFSGMNTEEVTVGGRSIIDVIMTADATQLDEAIVVAYGVATKRSFTGSASSIKSDKASSGSLESIDKALTGKISGLKSSNVTGDPGSPAKVSIRGVGSISANTDPLYVVDGVVALSNSDMDMGVYKSKSVLSSLNPDDIESVTVLKDAAASSLYGSRAANGVIVITTKKGKQGKTRFNYSGQFGQSSMASNSFEVMGTSDLAKYEHAALMGYYLYGQAAFYPNQANFANRESYYAAASTFADNNTPFVINDYDINTNWKDVIYRKAFSQDHQFSVSGGGEKTQFYVGLGYNNTAGIVMGSSFERYSFRMNLDHKAYDWLDLSFKQMLSWTDQKGFRDKSGQDVGIPSGSPLGVLLAMNPSEPEYNADGSVNLYPALPGSNAMSPHEMFTSSIGRYSSSNSTESLHSMTTGILGIRFAPWLRFTETAAIDISYDQMLDRWAPESLDGASINGLADRRSMRGAKITSSSILNYNQSFGNHNLSALAGFEAERFASLYITASTSNLSTWQLPELGVGQVRAASSQKDAYTMASVLGSVNYNYDNKYYLSASLRSDGSSRLSEDERWGTFWSVSGAWNLSRESFMQASWLDDLRIKASYGTNGTLPPGYYTWRQQYAMTSGYGSAPAIYWYSLGNPNLTWEKSNTFNIGFEAQFIKKLGLSVEYYNKKTKDLIMTVPTSYITGFSGYTGNNGDIKNSGVEIELRAFNIQAGDFSWNSEFNIAFQKATVDKLPGGEDVLAGHDSQYIYREGEDMWSFYLPEWAGIDKETGIGYFYVDRDVDDTKTFIYNAASRKIVGKAIPDFLGGFSNTFTFKGVDLSFLVTYQFGADAFDYPGYFMNSDGVRLRSIMPGAHVANNFWTPDNRDVDNPMPMYNYNAYRFDLFSTRTLFSTDHIRMKEISLGYTFPKNITEKMKLDNLRVYFKAVNPFMIWQKADNVDPEVTLNGYRTTDTPPIRVWSFGINIGF